MFSDVGDVSMKLPTRLAYLVAFAAASLSAPAFADCVYPKAPDEANVDGATATEAQVRAANAAMNTYSAAITAYQNCLELETPTLIAAAGPNVTADEVKRIRATQAEKSNAAFDELQTRIAEYKKQAHIFLSRPKS
jgi:hypothetical protein